MENLELQKEDINKKVLSISLVVLVLLSLISAFIFTNYGYKYGLLPLAISFAAVFIYIVIKEPKFAVIALMLGSYFIIFLITLVTTTFPLGTLMDGMLAILTLAFFIKQKYNRNYWIFKNPISYILVIWISYNILQFFNPAAASRLAWLYTIRSVALVMLSYYIFTYYIDNVKFLRTILMLWLGLCVFAALWAIKQEYFGFFGFEEKNHYDQLYINLNFIDGRWRKNSIFSDPVSFSYNMAAAALLCLGLMTGPYKTKYKVLLGSMAVLFLTVMTYSGTRSAYILVPAAFLMFVVLKLNRFLIAITIPISLAFLILINVPTSNITLTRFQSAFRPNEDASYNVRKLNQKRVQPFIQTHPFGGGLGGSGIWGVRFAPNSFLAQFPPDSGYVRVALELGWVGLLLICSIMFTALYVGIKNFFTIKDPELRAICLSMILIVFAFSLANYPQEAIVQYPLSIYFYLVLAIITLTKVFDDKKQGNMVSNLEKKKKLVDYRVV
ncbi:O-antigen ligase family protein [Pedobacter sp. SD-b]|uniref:O-antigen ligase family protein n=1 Tax=Pedobacter segetis TaxID=2793069 RepID=A0ABS1BMY3_9SPHI|nr:O-antigen ligase family protein [Pedobacter segetis]MBK0383666.1 O-antigen ligase family protein [Pedobacter segetis]